jgi:hypothetical protein
VIAELLEVLKIGGDEGMNEEMAKYQEVFTFLEWLHILGAIEELKEEGNKLPYVPSSLILCFCNSLVTPTRNKKTSSQADTCTKPKKKPIRRNRI